MRGLVLIGLMLGAIWSLEVNSTAGDLKNVSSSELAAANSQDKLDLKVTLVADRAVYRRKDEIRLKVMIINDSGINDAFVYYEMGFGHRAGFMLIRRDARGHEVPTRFIHDFRPDPPNLNDPTSFVKLRPGHFLGFTYENSIYNLNLEKPGTYKLSVEYHSPILSSDVKVKPFWGAENSSIESNVVTIVVRP